MNLISGAMDTSSKIDDWIFRYCYGELTEQEREALGLWIDASPEHENYFREEVREIVRLKVIGKWEKSEQAEYRLWSNINRATIQRRRLMYIRLARVVAVAVVVLFCTIGVLYQTWRVERPDLEITDVLHAESGSPKALLTLGTGKQISLGEGERKEILKEKQVTVLQDSAGGIRYEVKADSVQEEIVEENMISVPVGGEYYVVLSDGSKVWLNSDSELTFPVRFTSETRTVSLRGEGYFEIVSDSAKPFYVKTDQGQIRVLGTAFNVSAYSEDSREEIALLSGKVRFDLPHGESVVLSPGEIVVYSKEKQGLTLTTGDVEAIVAWKTGRFNFVDMSLEDLVVKLERWYRISFRFKDETCRNLRFTGAVTKYRTLDYVLDMISKTTAVRFESEGEQVTVYLKK